MKNQTGTTVALEEAPAQTDTSTTTIAEALVKANADKAADTRRTRDAAKTAKTDVTQVRKDLKRVTEARDAATAQLAIREVEVKQLSKQVVDTTTEASTAVAASNAAQAQLALWQEEQVHEDPATVAAQATAIAELATADVRIKALLDEVIVVTRERDEAVAEVAALRAEVDKLTATSEDLQRQTSSLQNQVSDLVPGVTFDATSRVGQALQRLRFGLKRSYKVALLVILVVLWSPCMKIGNTWGAESFVSPVAMLTGQTVTVSTGMWWWKSHFIQVDRPLLGLRYIPITVD